jgi:ABC-type antimicrobial peptide transport system permease subunit
MTWYRLLLRNLLYHWRGNLAVFLGVALGTAILTGALLVGDSLRGSLRELTVERLGWVEEAMVPGRFFRERLAVDLRHAISASAIFLSGSAANAAANGQADGQARRAGGVTVLGVDANFWAKAPPIDRDFWDSDAAEVVLNRTLAHLLSAQAGDTITLRLPRPDDIPRESLLGKRRASDVLHPVQVKVRLVLPDEGLARFSLKPNPEQARNAFVPRRLLQSELNLPGQVNAVLATTHRHLWQTMGFSRIDDDRSLAEALQQELTLDDWGLRLRTPKDRALALFHFLAPNSDEPVLKRARWRGRIPDALAEMADDNGGLLTRDQVIAFYEKHHPYFSLESRQLLLPPAAFRAGEAARLTLGAADPPRRVTVQSVLVYLVDTLTIGQHALPYVVVAGVDETQLPGLKYAGVWLDERRIAIAYPSGVKDVPPEGTPVEITYYAPDTHQRLQKERASFEVLLTLPLQGAADDPDLTPEFPGITDRLDIGDWQNPPFPFDRKRITPAEEDYWRRYRATPRAYISLERAQQLWGSRFGSVTSMQFYGADAKELTDAILKNLMPQRGNFVFQPVRANAEKASAGSNDFGVLFLAFSFFLIASALLLVGLLLRLNLERRASEMGLLLATGWSHGQVRRLLLGEGALLAMAGGLVGLGGALGYAWLMLGLLRANWPGGDSLNFLRLHAGPLSFVYGYFGSLVVSILTIVWATRALGKLSPRALLAGETAPALTIAKRGGRPWSWWVLLLSLVGAGGALLAGFTAQGHEAKAGSFFGSGALLLIACLAGVRIWLRRTGAQAAPRPSLTALGVRNAGRHAVRSLLTVGLLAAATFLIVAVESFHKDVGTDFLAQTGGSGGFALIAETDVPIFQDLNLPDVRKEWKLTGPLLERARFHACRISGGDDTSCLNLYQPLRPRVLGLPPSAMGDRFHFSAAMRTPEGERVPPWSLLERSLPNGAIPAAVDATSAEYTLHKKLGETVEVTNERGDRVSLLLAALLEESIFQSEIVVTEESFRRLFPQQEGFSFFLVECDGCSTAEIEQVQALLEKALAKQGVRVQTTASRLQAYFAVENTYLATFQALGGLGLVLGAVGLAIILLRGVWERRGELALLRALGFSRLRLAWLVLAENLALLLLGLAAGTASALLSVAPHLVGGAAHVLWLRIGLLLLVVLATGLVAGSLAVVTTLRAPLLTALRRE